MTRRKIPLTKHYLVSQDELDFTLEVWPDTLPDTPCWYGGPVHFRAPNGKLMTALRYLAYLSLGKEMPAGLHFHRLCKTPRCRNLLHYEVR